MLVIKVVSEAMNRLCFAHLSKILGGTLRYKLRHALLSSEIILTNRCVVHSHMSPHSSKGTERDSWNERPRKAVGRTDRSKRVVLRKMRGQRHRQRALA